jgi:hypothetical protein
VIVKWSGFEVVMPLEFDAVTLTAYVAGFSFLCFENLPVNLIVFAPECALRGLRLPTVWLHLRLWCLVVQVLNFSVTVAAMFSSKLNVVDLRQRLCDCLNFEIDGFGAIATDALVPDAVP